MDGLLERRHQKTWLYRNDFVRGLHRDEFNKLNRIDMCVDIAAASIIYTMHDLIDRLIFTDRRNFKGYTVERFTQEFGYIGHHRRVKHLFNPPTELLESRIVPHISTKEVVSYVIQHIFNRQDLETKRVETLPDEEASALLRQALEKLAEEKEVKDYTHLGIFLKPNVAAQGIMYRLLGNYLRHVTYVRYKARKDLQHHQVLSRLDSNNVSNFFNLIEEKLAKSGLVSAWVLLRESFVKRFGAITKG